MKLTIKNANVYATLSAAVATLCIVIAMQGRAPAPETGDEEEVGVKAISEPEVRGKRAHALARIAQRRKATKKNKRDVNRASGEDAPPETKDAETGEPTEEEPLTEQQKIVQTEIQSALDENDLAAVRRAIAKFKSNPSRGGLGGTVPKSMRMQAVQALGWFGKDGAIDLVEFLGDGDEEIASDAYDAFELAMSSGDMSEEECSTYLKSIMTALTDAERIDNLLIHLMSMDNSLRAETIKGILVSGTDKAKEVMGEQLEFYTDIGVVTVTDVERWAQENSSD